MMLIPFARMGALLIGLTIAVAIVLVTTGTTTPEPEPVPAFVDLGQLPTLPLGDTP